MSWTSLLPVRFKAGFDGLWQHRPLKQNQISTFFLDPTSIQVPRRARRTKTDRVNVATMLRVLMVYCREDIKTYSDVSVLTVVEADSRRTHRERRRLPRERIQHTNRIQRLLAAQELLAAQDMSGFRPARREWEQQLEHLRIEVGRLLPPYLKWKVRRECRRLAAFNEMSTANERIRDQTIAGNSSDPKNATSLLLRLKGPVLHSRKSSIKK